MPVPLNTFARSAVSLTPVWTRAAASASPGVRPSGCRSGRTLTVVVGVTWGGVAQPASVSAIAAAAAAATSRREAAAGGGVGRSIIVSSFGYLGRRCMRW
jgi:hypothetical protein